MSPLQWAAAEIVAEFFQLSSCCFPLGSLDSSLSILSSGVGEEFERVISVFEAYAAVSHPSPEFPLWISGNSVAMNLIKLQLSAWVPVALCFLQTRNALGKSCINLNLFDCISLLSVVRFSSFYLLLVLFSAFKSLFYPEFFFFLFVFCFFTIVIYERVSLMSWQKLLHYC